MDQELLAKFRQEEYPKFIEKGVKPPELESPEERGLLERWLKGKEKLRRLTNGA